MDIDDEAAELCVQPRLHEAEKAVRAELPGYAIAKKGIQDDGVIAVLIGIQELLAIGDMTVHLVGQAEIAAGQLEGARVDVDDRDLDPDGIQRSEERV